MEQFAIRLRQLRLQEKKSQRVLSELCGLPPGAVRRYENCEADPSLRSLVAIAEYFDVSIDWLVGR